MASDEKNSRTAKMYDIVVDYSGYSTLAGLIYVFMPGQPLIGKVLHKSLKQQNASEKCK
jgi:hypothetical protein